MQGRLVCWKPSPLQQTLVTRLDKEVQKPLVSEILSHYPEDKICAEEGCLRASVQEGRFGLLIRLMGPITLSPSRKIFVMMAYFENGGDSLP